MTRFWRALVAAVLLPAVAWAQAQSDERRLPLRGEVVDSEGAPQAGARVTLVSQLFPRIDLGLADRVETATDERGEFVVGLLPARTYVAWATVEKERVYLATEESEGVSPGSFLTLRLDGEERLRPRLAVRGCVQWRDRLPLTLRARTAPGLPLFEVAFSSDTQVDLPPMPGKAVWMTITDRAGERLWPRTRAPARLAAPSGGAVSPLELRCDAPRSRGRTRRSWRRLHFVPAFEPPVRTHVTLRK